MNASRNKPGRLASLGNVHSRPRYRERYFLPAGRTPLPIDVQRQSNACTWAKGSIPLEAWLPMVAGTAQQGDLGWHGGGLRLK
jgi:hypothetical protein